MMKYRADIDGLRALAVVPVVLYHAGVPGFPGGFVGVDIFFVISGYLICGTIDADIRSGSFSLGNFYKRRALRILPALFAMFLVTSILAYLYCLPVELEDYARASRARSVRFRISTLRARPGMTRPPRPSRCCIPSRSASKSSSISSFPC
jgi:peptidoglycan/LPS O-acetylase OafA/YrhL